MGVTQISKAPPKGIRLGAVAVKVANHKAVVLVVLCKVGIRNMVVEEVVLVLGVYLVHQAMVKMEKEVVPSTVLEEEVEEATLIMDMVEMGETGVHIRLALA